MSIYLIILLYLLVVLTVVVIIVNTNSTSKALAYLMMVFIFPVAGIIIYFSVGVNYRKRKLYKKKLEIDEQKRSELDVELKKYRSDILNHSKKLNYFQKLAESEHQELLLTTNQKTDLLINGEEKFPKLIEDLKSAKKFIHIEYYIYENDNIGNEIAEILMEKAQQGIEVRFIYDDFGSSGLQAKFKQKLKKSGVEAVPFYKIKWLFFASRINYRNHRKIVVIDGKVGYIGGINVSDKYINNGKNSLFWRDTHLRIEGLAVHLLQHAFLVDWNFCARQNIELTPRYFPKNKTESEAPKQLVQIVSSGPDSDYPNILYAMVQAIMLSREEILITTPYFIPDDTFLDALKIAALSGVKIKILVPGVSDSVFVNLVSTSYYQKLLEAGIEIYRYKKGFVHAKTMICDDLVSFIGTTNLDHRSFDLNFEIHAIVYDEELTQQHKTIMQEDFRNTEKLELSEWKKRSMLKIFMERIARLFSPLM